ncbi:MAG: tRNA lysidine(34) synthetase TilS, partial [bacterium]
SKGPVPLQSVEAFLGQPTLRRFPRSLVVAVSGGADSAALLLACAEAAPRLGWAVEALHCDHGLRGRASQADAALVRTLCVKLHVPLHEFSTALKPGTALEERARAWRRACYAEAAQKCGAALILLAHHAHDQAETLLLNLVRGSGLSGAAAMLDLSPLDARITLGRPFLQLQPQALRSWLRSRGQAWREDASNRDPTFARNRIRIKILPELERLNPKAVAHLAAFAQALAPAKRPTDLAGLLRLDRAARERATKAIAKGAGQADLGQGWTLELSAGQTRVLAPASKGLALTKPGAWNWGSWRFELKLVVPSPRTLLSKDIFWFSPILLRRGARIRTLKPGELLAPYGFLGRRKASDLLRESGVPDWARADWPALEAEGRLLALPGIRRGRGFEAQAGKMALRLSWQSPPSTR